MITFRVIFFALLSLMVGCAHQYYSSVTVLSREETDTGSRITFSAPIATMYWCPGADTVEDDTTIYVRFVRSKFDSRPKVALPATFVKGTMSQFIDVPNPKKKRIVIGTPVRS
ncbi:MAG: hypothetical protein QM760_05860 [Nibricoccus sp.]